MQSRSLGDGAGGDGDGDSDDFSDDHHHDDEDDGGADVDQSWGDVTVTVAVLQASAQRASGDSCTTKVTFTRAMLVMKALTLGCCQGLALQLRSMYAKRRQPDPNVEPDVYPAKRSC